MAITPESEFLHGLVDMGSNGIRFSISDLSPPTTRILPTVYTSRAGISLYDAQYNNDGTRIPIPESTIQKVLHELSNFKRTCTNFAVPETNVTILATEATRTAVNSEEFRARILERTGWSVKLLAKEEEGRVGARGVATSLGSVEGLMMDLGGGSTQLTWLISGGDGEVRMPASGAVSMPFGAAALSRRMVEAEKIGGGAKQALAVEIRQRIEEAYRSLEVPAELKDLAKKEGGFALYLSGGGFRGWGFVLMSQHAVSPYPIASINGFKAARKDFLDTTSVQTAVKDTIDDEAIFRISQRRADQVPAVAFLVTALSEALPQIKEVRFCQGGVREGYLFSTLPNSIRKQEPIVVATSSFAAPASQHFADLLAKAVPKGTKTEVTGAIMVAFANTLNYFSTHPKDIRAPAALRSTSTGILASAHGLSHDERAILALLLCERWGGVADLPPTDVSFYESLQTLVGPLTAWWTKYLGRVGELIGDVYPSGRGEEVLGLAAKWGRTGKGNEILELKVKNLGGGKAGDLFGDEMQRVEKVGKKKNWIGGKDGVGYRVEVVG